MNKVYANALDTLVAQAANNEISMMTFFEAVASFQEAYSAAVFLSIEQQLRLRHSHLMIDTVVRGRTYL